MKVAAERWSRNALSRLIGLIAPAKKTDPAIVLRRLRENPSAKILIIRPHQGLGDLLLATPLFRALKKEFPNVELHFLADTYNAVAIRENLHFGNVWVWDKKRMQNIFQFIAFFRTLRAQKFTVAMPLSSHVPSFTSYLIARLSGAEYVWAYDTLPFYDGATWSRHLAHVEMKNRPEEDPEWVKFVELARPLLGDGARDDYAPEFNVTPEAAARAQEIWKSFNIPAGNKKIGLFFGGNPDRPERLWPADYWTDLAVRLQKTDGVSLVSIVPPADFLSGSRAVEKGVYPQIAPHLNASTPVYSNTELPRVAAFLQGLDLFVCVDGGLFHIAVASRVPTLGLFFKTDPARWKPPVPWTTVLRPADDQPRSLTPDQVYQQIREMVLKSKISNVH